MHIDFRVHDGQLYGVGNGGGIYRINKANAAAVRVNSLTEALSGTSFSVDFNPAADRLRVVSNTGQNLLRNVNAGGTTIADGPLTASGKLGDDVGPVAGFDIYSVLSKGMTIANRAYAVLHVNGEHCFYRINLLTGAAT